MESFLEKRFPRGLVPSQEFRSPRQKRVLLCLIQCSLSPPTHTACFTHATPEKGKHQEDIHLSGVGDRGKLQVLRVPLPEEAPTGQHDQAAVPTGIHLDDVHSCEISAQVGRHAGDIIVTHTCLHTCDPATRIHCLFLPH